ncbi:hypothetical protein Tco_0134017 [Tanacetum coccineum]
MRASMDADIGMGAELISQRNASVYPGRGESGLSYNRYFTESRTSLVLLLLSATLLIPRQRLLIVYIQRSSSSVSSRRLINLHPPSVRVFSYAPLGVSLDPPLDQNQVHSLVIRAQVKRSAIVEAGHFMGASASEGFKYRGRYSGQAHVGGAGSTGCMGNNSPFAILIRDSSVTPPSDIPHRLPKSLPGFGVSVHRKVLGDADDVRRHAVGR